jgi:hypothetical protein
MAGWFRRVIADSFRNELRAHFIPMIPGMLYGPNSWFVAAKGDAGMNLNNLSNNPEFIPLVVPHTAHFDQLLLNISATVGTLYFAVYECSLEEYKPTALIADLGSMNTNHIGVTSISIDLTLPQGLYLIAAVTGGSTSTAAAWTITNVITPRQFPFGGSGFNTPITMVQSVDPITPGSWPDPWIGDLQYLPTLQMPWIELRFTGRP